MELLVVLTWIIAEGGGGVLAYWLIEHVKRLAALAPEPKRYVSWVLAGVIAVAAYLLSMVFGGVAVPGEWREWVRVLFAVASGAILAGQTAHARIVLSKKQVADPDVAPEM